MTVSGINAPAEGLRFSDLCQFTEKQWSATEAADQYRFVLYGGSRGPGKSYWLRWLAVRWLLTWAAQGHENVRVMLGSENYPALYERHITKIEMEFPAWLGDLHRARNDYRLKPEYGGGVIALRNLDDASKYQSSEFAAILIDELTKNSFRTFTQLRGSLRWRGIGDTKFAAATNPAPNWVRDLWVSRHFDNPDFPEYHPLQPLAEQFYFVKALPGDNPHLGEQYWDDLNTLPDALRRAWRDGDWFVAMEGIVYPEFTEANVTAIVPDPDLPVELAFDDGYIDPRVVLFIQRTGTEVRVFDEIYVSRQLAAETVQAVLDRMTAHFGPDPAGAEVELLGKAQVPPAVMPELAVGSPEAVELHQHFRRADIPSRHLSHRIVEGIKVVRTLIRDGNDYRALKVDPRCRNFINELTSGYRYPEDGKRRDNEKPLDGNDHACDAFRYWAWMRAR